MNKASMYGMRLHQAVSFSRFMMRVRKAEAVFWPGCALLTLERGILLKTLSVLRRAEPDIALAAGCCGQPTRYLFPDKFDERRERLRDIISSHGVKRIYTACPNCTVQLSESLDADILPIWQTIAANITRDDIVPQSGAYVWHDPCPTRDDPAQQEACRSLLKLSGADFAEPEHTGAKTLCCGNFRMMHILNPKAGKSMLDRRTADFPSGPLGNPLRGRSVVSSCEGCLGAFRGAGLDTIHLLELLFGRSGSRGWRNRVINTVKI